MMSVLGKISASLGHSGGQRVRSRERLLAWGIYALLVCFMGVLAWDAYTFYAATAGVRVPAGRVRTGVSAAEFSSSVSKVTGLFAGREARHRPFDTTLP